MTGSDYVRWFRAELAIIATIALGIDGVPVANLPMLRDMRAWNWAWTVESMRAAYRRSRQS